MARIDVTEILDDPDFEDEFDIVRSTETVGPDGRAVFTPQILAYAGVIQPASGRALLLIPDDARVQGAIEIWTRNHLRMNDGTFAADIVQWQNRSYVVSAIDDFFNYGNGYVHAVCTLHNVVGPSQRRNELD